MHYIMILVIYASSPSGTAMQGLTSAEFNSEAACRSAIRQFNADIVGMSNGAKYSAICAEKGLEPPKPSQNMDAHPTLNLP